MSVKHKYKDFSIAPNCLRRAFKPYEVTFMLYMKNLDFLRQQKYYSPASVKYHMLETNISYRQFNYCIDKMQKMGLLTVCEQTRTRDYKWDTKKFDFLIEKLSMCKDPIKLKDFCDEKFETKKMDINLVKEDDWRKLAPNYQN